MPNRCGCANACSCLVVAGDGISVEGIGTLENPYEITSESSDLVGRVEFTDEGNVDFTATGVGTINDPLTVFGSAVMDLGDLSDVPDTEADDGDILVWRIDGWVYEQPAVVGPTLPPGGTDGQVLTKQSDLDGDADWETFAGGGGGGGAVMEPLVVGVYQRTTAYSATNTAGAIVVWDSVEQAAQGITYNSTTGQFTCVTAGLYLITARMRFNFSGTTNVAAYNQMRLLKNGAIWDFGHVPYTPTGTAAHTIDISRQIPLVAGDVVAIQVVPGGATVTVDMTVSTTHTNSIEISKVPELSPGGGGVVVERPVQGIVRRTTALTTDASSSPITWDTVELAPTGVTWDGVNYTIQTAGLYQVSVSARVQPATATATGYIQARILKNGGAYDFQQFPFANTTGSALTARVTRYMYLNIGDYIGGGLFTPASNTATLVVGSTTNAFEIVKVPAAYAGSAVSTYGERNYASGRRNAAAQSIPSSTWTIVTLDTETYTDGISWDSGNQFTIPVDGYYEIDGGVQFAGNATGYRGVGLYLSASQMYSTTLPANGTSGASVAASGTVKASAGQNITLRCWQNSGGNLALSTGVTATWLTVTKVPAPVINGAAASGVWGVAPLETSLYGTDSLIGREVYIDSKGQLRAKPDVIEMGPGVDLNTITRTGQWTQSQSGDATSGTNYPVPVAGLLEVTSSPVVGSGSMVWQRYTAYATHGTYGGRIYTRGMYNGTWDPWVEVHASGAWKDCTLEMRWCTDTSTVANAGQYINAAKYTKIGKTVTLSGHGLVGTCAVANFALLLPPSAGVPAWRQAMNPWGMIAAAQADDASGGLYMTADLTRVYGLTKANAVTDAVASLYVRFQFTYEVV